MDFCHVFVFCLMFLTVLLFVGYRRVDFVKYHVKYLFYYICLGIFSLISIPYSLLRPCRIENIWFPCWMIRRMRWWLRCDLVEIRGKENIETDGPFMLVCNHQSSLDLYTFAHIWPTRCTSVMKREIMYGTGFFGFATWLCGSIAIDRLNPQSAKSTVNVISDRLRNENIIVLIFPEGTRHHGEGMLPFKKGAFNIAVNAQVPVVPLVISSYKSFMDRYFFNDGKFIMSVLPPVSTVGLEYSDVPELADRVRCQMLTEFNKISKEVETLVKAEQKAKSS